MQVVSLVLLALSASALGALVPRASTPSTCVACQYLDKNSANFYYMQPATNGFSCTYLDSRSQSPCSYSTAGALASGQNAACPAAAAVMGTQCPSTGYSVSSYYVNGNSLYCGYNCPSGTCSCTYQLSSDLSHSVALTSGSSFCPSQSPACATPPPPKVCTACPYVDINAGPLFDMESTGSGFSCTYYDTKAKPSSPTCSYTTAGALASGQNAACPATAGLMGAKCPALTGCTIYESALSSGAELYCQYNCASGSAATCNYQLSSDLSHSTGLTTGTPANVCPSQAATCS